MMVSRILTSIYVDNLQLSKQFYMDLLGLTPIFEADWIVQLSDINNKNINLTLQPKNDALIPESFRKKPQGFSLAFVVDDCDKVYVQALALKLDIIQPPKNEDYGQRRFLTIDPDGVLVDVSSVCESSPEFIKKYFGNENA